MKLKFDCPTELVQMALLMGILGGFAGADACHALPAQIGLFGVGVFLGTNWYAKVHYDWQVKPKTAPTIDPKSRC